jgi:hypothetical protein
MRGPVAVQTPAQQSVFEAQAVRENFGAAHARWLIPIE